MEDKNEHDFERVTNQEPSLVQETYVPIEQVNNPLPTCTKLVQLVQPKPIYIFLQTFITYVQHESLKHVTLLFEQATLVAQT
jgi:hypothetical protein